MSTQNTARRLVAIYPVRWRARYGDELVQLIVDMAGGGPVPWRTRREVVLAGLSERMRGGPAPDAPWARRGLVMVLWAWALFVVGGSIVQKTSEHWQGALPRGSGVATTAFTVLTAAALAGSACVLIAAAVTVPGVWAALRSEAAPRIRGALRRVVAPSMIALLSTVALVVWAHHLSAAARNGHNVPYAVAFLIWAAALVACLAAWVGAAAGILNAVPLGPRVIGVQTWLSTGVCAAMAVSAAATVAWWIATALRAPGALVGSAAPGPHSALVPQLVLGALVMVIAASVGAAGSRVALSGQPRRPLGRRPD